MVLVDSEKLVGLIIRRMNTSEFSHELALILSISNSNSPVIVFILFRSIKLLLFANNTQSICRHKFISPALLVPSCKLIPMLLLLPPSIKKNVGLRLLHKFQYLQTCKAANLDISSCTIHHGPPTSLNPLYNVYRLSARK